jgi:hypothetical protein
MFSSLPGGCVLVVGTYEPREFIPAAPDACSSDRSSHPQASIRHWAKARRPLERACGLAAKIVEEFRARINVEQPHEGSGIGPRLREGLAGESDPLPIDGRFQQHAEIDETRSGGRFRPIEPSGV